MNAQELQPLLADHFIGETPYQKLLGLIAPQYYKMMGQMAHDMIAFGVIAARWESANATQPSDGVWRERLVLTLAEKPFPQEPGSPGKDPSDGWGMLHYIYEQSTHDRWTLQHINYLALQICGCNFYQPRGSELWLEFTVASEQAITEMTAVLIAGQLGKYSFPEYLRESTPHWFSAGMQAYRMGLFGITKLRWETPPPPPVSAETIAHYARHFPHDRVWRTALVATLPLSPFAAPPGLPSYDLIRQILSQSEVRGDHDIRVKENDVELRVWYSYVIPWTEEQQQHLQAEIAAIEAREHKAS